MREEQRQHTDPQNRDQHTIDQKERHTRANKRVSDIRSATLAALDRWPSSPGARRVLSEIETHLDESRKAAWLR